MTPAQAAAPDFVAIKQRQQATWASGDFAVIGTTLQIVGEMLAEAVDVRACERVLDVAAGKGNATLAAARRFAHATSTDYVPVLLEKRAERAEDDGLSGQFLFADAEDFPFPDASFDAVLSTFGAMFTPEHARAANEMLRVLRHSGRVGMANWASEGFVGRLYKVIGPHVPPAAGPQSPALRGTETHLASLVGARASKVECQRRHFQFRYRLFLASGRRAGDQDPTARRCRPDFRTVRHLRALGRNAVQCWPAGRRAAPNILKAPSITLTEAAS